MKKQIQFFKTGVLSDTDTCIMEDLYVLLCLTKFANHEGECFPSIPTIQNMCYYQDPENGKEYKYGRVAVNASLKRLEKDGKIQIVKKNGSVNSYKILRPNQFEKVGVDFITKLQAPISVKAYLLCYLHHSFNKHTGIADCQYRIDKLAEVFHTNISNIKRCQAFLTKHGIMVTTMSKDKKDQETKLPITERKVDLSKILVNQFYEKIVEIDAQVQENKRKNEELEDYIHNEYKAEIKREIAAEILEQLKSGQLKLDD